MADLEKLVDELSTLTVMITAQHWLGPNTQTMS